MLVPRHRRDDVLSASRHAVQHGAKPERIGIRRTSSNRAGGDVSPVAIHQKPCGGMLVRILMAGVRFYQRFLSPLKPMPTCRFLPTCSSYALEALERRGVIVGTALTIWRILRCNPLFPGGYDPVKPKRDRELTGSAAPPCEHAAASQRLVR